MIREIPGRACYLYGVVRAGAPLSVNAVGIDAIGQRLGVFEQRGETRAERQPPDRIDVDPHGAQERQPVGFGLRQGALVRQDVVVAGFGQAQRTDHSASVAARVSLGSRRGSTLAKG